MIRQWNEIKTKKVKVKKMQTAKRAITSIVYSFLGIRILRLKNSDLSQNSNVFKNQNSTFKLRIFTFFLWILFLQNSDFNLWILNFFSWNSEIEIKIQTFFSEFFVIGILTLISEFKLFFKSELISVLISEFVLFSQNS